MRCMVKKAVSRRAKKSAADTSEGGTEPVRVSVFTEHMAAIRAYAKLKGITQNSAVCIAIAEFVERSRK